MMGGAVNIKKRLQNLRDVIKRNPRRTAAIIAGAGVAALLAGMGLRNISQLKKKLAEQKKATQLAEGKIGELEAELGDRAAEIKELDAEIAGRRKELRRLEGKGKSEAPEDDAAALRDEIEELQKRLRSKQKAVGRLETQLARAEERERERAQELEQLENAHRQLRGRLAQRDETLAARIVDISQLKELSPEVQAELEELTQKAFVIVRDYENLIPKLQETIRTAGKGPKQRDAQMELQRITEAITALRAAIAASPAKPAEETKGSWLGAVLGSASFFG